MAVDANVLIYERIREEVRAGKTPIAAIDAGFTRAFITIADCQLTTLACAAVMFWLGSGPIRGFAVTLTIGICTSIFASVTVVRLLISFWLRRRPRRAAHRSAGLGQAAMKLIPNFKGFDFFPHDLRLPFMRYKGAGAGRCRSSPWRCRWLLFFTVKGFNYGVDFKGGSMIEVQSTIGPGRHRPLRDKLGRLGLGAVQIQSFGAPTDVLIRVEQQPGGDGAQQAALKKVRRCAGDGYMQRRVEVVGPAVSSELRMTGIIAVARRPAGHRRLRVVPVRMAVRARRDRGADPRRAADRRHLLAVLSSSSTCRSWRRC